MMLNSLNVLLENSIFSKLLCDTDSCLSYIIILLDILSVFYLVFCSYYKITKRVRLIGYIWSVILLCSTVVIMFFHTCIFTITGVVFTIMIEMAMLSVVFNHDKSSENDKVEKSTKTKKKNVGCYVIFPTNDNNFVFGLFDKKNNLIAMSSYKYSTVEEAKDAIKLSKVSGYDCEFEDLTQNWVADAKHPKFRMYLKKQKFFFDLAISEKLTILKSDAFEDAANCLRAVKDARICVTTDSLYFATSREDVKNGKKFPLFSLNESVQENVIEERVVEDDNEEQKDAKTLSESLKAMENVKTSNNINKQTLFEYLNGEYGDKVVLNRRENLTKTGLPLADTYYTYCFEKQENGKLTKKKVCFAYVYENNGACLVLAKLDKNYANSLRKSKKSIMPSKFPKSKLNDWYSIIVNDTFTEEEIHTILINAKEYCENN